MEFKVPRVSGQCDLSLITLNHGDVLVMDGSSAIGVVYTVRCVWAAGSSG